MQRFEAEMKLYALPLPHQFQDLFADLLKTCNVYGSTPDDSLRAQANFTSYYLSCGNLNEADTMMLFQCMCRLPRCWTVHVLSTAEIASWCQLH